MSSCIIRLFVYELFHDTKVFAIAIHIKTTHNKFKEFHEFPLTIAAAFTSLGIKLSYMLSTRNRFMPNRCIFSLALMLGIAFTGGCTKVPKELLGQGMKIDYSVINSKEVYTINFSGAIRNENRNTVMKNVKGKICIVDSDSKKKLVSMPFSLDVILPMSLGNIDLKVNLTEEEISPLLNYLNIDRNELASKGATDGQPLNGDQIVIENITFDKQDIIELLQEKL